MKREEKTELTKERIIQASLQEFGLHGYESTTLNSICNNHKISKGLLYHNFKGKDELYLICVERCFSDVTAYLQKQEILSDLHQYLELRFQYFEKHPLYARIFFEALLQPPKNLYCEIKQAKEAFESFNRCIYRTALSKLTLRAGITEEDALKYYELMQEMFNSYFSSPAYYEKDLNLTIIEHENALTKILDFILYGIAERSNTK